MIFELYKHLIHTPTQNPSSFGGALRMTRLLDHAGHVRLHFHWQRRRHQLVHRVAIDGGTCGVMTSVE